MTHHLPLRGAHKSLQIATAVTAALIVAVPAHAAGTGMPWEGPLDQILQSIEGPVARIVAVIIITLTGLALAFGETSAACANSSRSCLVCRSLLPRPASFSPSSHSAAER